jgi:hypothetical protein
MFSTSLNRRLGPERDDGAVLEGRNVRRQETRKTSTKWHFKRAGQFIEVKVAFPSSLLLLLRVC